MKFQLSKTTVPDNCKPIKVMKPQLSKAAFPDNCTQTSVMPTPIVQNRSLGQLQVKSCGGTSTVIAP